MKDDKFNLSEWALNHRSLMTFIMALVFFTGVLSYNRLGREEDPGYTVRTMVVQTQWPGASAKEVEQQVTDKIEKKLQELPGLDYLKSYSQPEKSTVFVNLKDQVKPKDVWPSFVKARNLVNDMAYNLPQGVQGPFFNDTYGDVYGSVYALTGAGEDGFSMGQLELQADSIRLLLKNVPQVSKVDLVGVQPQKIYVEIENSKMAMLGLEPGAVITTLQRQNAMNSSGRIETSSDNLYLRVTGIFGTVDNIRNIAINSNGRIFRLGDIGTVTRGYPDPPQPQYYFNGKPGIAITVSMETGGNVLKLGQDLKQAIARVTREMPAGMEIHQVSDQPKVVKESIGEFTESLLEAIIIVLAVSFLSLGVRAGLVVLVSMPLVLCTVFLAMEAMDITLQKISLGALIIALGLLVDDAMISVEMMECKLEEGWNKIKAAEFAYTATAFPMLTGTLVTASGFMPVAFSAGGASEYTASMFWVITIALVSSWIVAVTVIPLAGQWLLKARPHLATAEGEAAKPESKFVKKFRFLLEKTLYHRKLVIGATIGVFFVSLFCMKFVNEEFFPPSTRPELIVELTLPTGASIHATNREVQKITDMLKKEKEVLNFSSYVAQSAPRFVLVQDSSMAADNFAQIVILTEGATERDQLRNKVDTEWASQFPNVRLHTKVLSNGPPSPYPVMLRVIGEKHEKVQELADKVRQTMSKHQAVTGVTLDWYEKSPVAILDVDQDKARALGLDSSTLSTSMQASISGYAVSEYRERDKTIAIIVRNDTSRWKEIGNLRNLYVNVGQTSGKYVPLEQIAQIRYEQENELIWRRNVLPTITVQATIRSGYLGNDVAKDILKELDELIQSLPPGYSIEADGDLESSVKSSGELAAMYPVLVGVVMMLLMLQLQSISRMALVLLTAPLGMIGVCLALLLLQRPLGFVTQLGIIALSGMIIRNSVILIDQIEKHIAEGEHPWDAIIDSAIIRFRPIMLTAAAAILAMIPLIGSAFWGPMAVAIAGGLFVATILTLIYLPAAYAAWFKVKPKSVSDGAPEHHV